MNAYAHTHTPFTPFFLWVLGFSATSGLISQVVQCVILNHSKLASKSMSSNNLWPIFHHKLDAAFQRCKTKYVRQNREYKINALNPMLKEASWQKEARTYSLKILHSCSHRHTERHMPSFPIHTWVLFSTFFHVNVIRYGRVMRLSKCEEPCLVLHFTDAHTSKAAAVWFCSGL